MSRYAFQGTFRDGQGNIVEDGSVHVYLAGTDTAANIYTSSTIVTATTHVYSDEVGFFYFYVDSSDYNSTQQFKLKLYKENYTEKYYDNIQIYPTGVPGASIESVSFVANDMVFVDSNSDTITLTNAKVDLKGDKGDKGDTGATGANGADGIDGTDGVDGEGLIAGVIIAWPTETVPSGYLECDGSSLLRASYTDLFAVLSDDYGAADETHFNLPDYRGRFLRGWAHGQTTDPDRASRTAPGATGATITTGDHVGTEQADEFKSHTHTITPTLYQPGTGYVHYDTGSTFVNAATSINATGGNETRPINTNVMYCIKY
jgi:microcystin-dependent protein